jgi:hypothetical protein
MSRDTTATSTQIRYSLDSPPCGEDDDLTVSAALQSLSTRPHADTIHNAQRIPEAMFPPISCRNPCTHANLEPTRNENPAERPSRMHTPPTGANSSSLRAPMHSCNSASIDAHANFAQALARSARTGLTIVHKPQVSSSMQTQLSLGKHSRERTCLLHKFRLSSPLGASRPPIPSHASSYALTNGDRTLLTLDNAQAHTPQHQAAQERSVSLPGPRTSSLASCETANLRGRPAGSTVDTPLRALAPKIPFPWHAYPKTTGSRSPCGKRTFSQLEWHPHILSSVDSMDESYGA